MTTLNDTTAALGLLAGKANELNAKDLAQDAAIANAQTAADNAQAAANAASTSGGAAINDAAPTSTTETYSAERIEARALAIANARIVVALEGEDIGDLAAELMTQAAAQANLATGASVTAVDTKITNHIAVIGNTNAYDPVAHVNGILNF